MNTPLETALRHDRVVVAAALVIVVVCCWAWILAGAGMGMSGFEMTRHSQMTMDMMPPAPWDISYAALMFFMWWTMMIAMMLPSATPVILLATALNRRSVAARKPFGAAAWFAAGYLLAWAGFSAIAVSLQWMLQFAGLISGMLRSTEVVLSATLLVTAGVWQFTPFKRACLRHCRGPLDFLTRHKRAGHYGAFLMGMQHGSFCLGCCWFLMILLFVGGVMNLYWIAGLAIYVWVEKILPWGETSRRIMGGLLIAWGLAILAPHLSRAF